MNDMTPKKENIILLLTVMLCIGVTATSLVGILSTDFYFRETLNWQAQSRGQDLIDLLVVMPVLLVSGLLAWRGNKPARWIWGGALLYLVYTFCLFCFDVHFNPLFLFYCFNLGLSFYGLLFFVFFSHAGSGLWSVPDVLRKIIAWYFILVGVLFYTLWLLEVIPAMIDNQTPASLTEVGLPTNGVHVIDLSVFLPGLVITGILVWKKHGLGQLLAPVVLTFMILMNITIGGLMMYMQLKDLSADVGVIVIMFILAAFSVYLLVQFSLTASRTQSPSKHVAS